MSISLDVGIWPRKRVHLIRQAEIAECGFVCLAMIARYHGLEVDLPTLRGRLHVSQRGLTAKQIVGMAQQLGLASRAVRVPLSELGKLSLPVILHWNLDHFVVLERWVNGRALLHDPAKGTRWSSLDDLSACFTGVAIELWPSGAFAAERQKSPRLRLSDLWSQITGLWNSLIQLFVLTVVMQAFVLLSPYQMQIAVDGALPSLDADLLLVVSLGFALFAVIFAIATFMRGMVAMSAGTIIGFRIASNLGARLLRLPLDWYVTRHVGDILARFESIVPIQTMLAQGAIVVLVDGVLALATLGVMFLYNAKLTLLALAAFVVYASIRAALIPAQRNTFDEAMRAYGAEQTTMMESLRSITTLRLANREMQRHAEWQAKLSISSNAMAHRARLVITHSSANSIIFGLETIFSIYVAIRIVMEGGFSLGMLFAYMAYKTQFLSSGKSFIDQMSEFQMLRVHLARLSDIALTKEDVSFVQTAREMPTLTGRIELKDVCYRYSATDPWVLRNVNVTVAPGEHLAITGASGAGKSTLAKVVLGLIEPSSGAVLVDGEPLIAFGHRHYRDQVAAVLQDDELLFGSILDNIVLYDGTPDMDLATSSARAAAILDEILAMPRGFNTQIGQMGSLLSGGQKQRVLLARALYRRPKVLLMDEGTAHLDAPLERRINSSISQLGITRIVIAHRRETIACADRILVLRDGGLDETPSNRLSDLP